MFLSVLTIVKLFIILRFTYRLYQSFAGRFTGVIGYQFFTEFAFWSLGVFVIVKNDILNDTPFYIDCLLGVVLLAYIYFIARMARLFIRTNFKINKTADRLVILVDEEIHKKQFEKAKRILGTHQHLVANESELLMRLGMIYENLMDFEAALNCYENAVDKTNKGDLICDISQKVLHLSIHQLKEPMLAKEFIEIQLARNLDCSHAKKLELLLEQIPE